MSIQNLPDEHTRAPWTIPDPGSGGTIDVKKSGVCNLVSAGAEARSLPAPLYPFQMIMLIMDTDGGNITVTAASAINQTGNTIMTFANAGEAILLIAGTVGGVLFWRAFPVEPETEGPALS